jgi:hypothetical protein
VSGTVVVAGLDLDAIERYLASVLGGRVRVVRLADLGDDDKKALKGFGYGTPVRIDYQIGSEHASAVLHTMAPGPAGHDHMADRARVLLWSNQAFNRLPRHIRAYDVGGFQPGGDLLSLGRVEEFCLLTEYAEGTSYASDLERLEDTGALTGLDSERADALCDYLVGIHRVRGTDDGLYVRRIRELVGDGECIMGLADSYPPHPLFTPQVLEEIEQRAVRWRWRLKGRTHRLRQVHGDFHPWNILFGPGAAFRLLDRSRGEFGDPADDVTSLTLNYVFFSLQRSERLEGAFEEMFRRFWDRYVEQSGDREIFEVAAPFLAFRGLVMASPVWYPHLSETVRRKLLAFINAVLEADTFDPALVNSYCGD